jgi:hypothetical protein
MAGRCGIYFSGIHFLCFNYLCTLPGALSCQYVPRICFILRQPPFAPCLPWGGHELVALWTITAVGMMIHSVLTMPAIMVTTPNQK